LRFCADEDDATYRAIYTAKIGDIIYVLLAFKKKAPKGIRTPERLLALIAQRLKEAKTHYASYNDKESGSALHTGGSR
jgi:phage-related protein